MGGPNLTKNEITQITSMIRSGYDNNTIVRNTKRSLGTVCRIRRTLTDTDMNPGVQEDLFDRDITAAKYEAMVNAVKGIVYASFVPDAKKLPILRELLKDPLK